MNTQSVLNVDKEVFREKILDLMFKDGFGFDEADDHLVAYAKEIFGLATPTAVVRVRGALNQMRKEGTT